jgi:hypothetical protein
MPDKMPDGMSEFMPDRMPDGMSEYLPDKMPDGISECMSDRMSLGGDHSKKATFFVFSMFGPFSYFYFYFFYCLTCFNKHNVSIIVGFFHPLQFLNSISLCNPFCHQSCSLFFVLIQM